MHIVQTENMYMILVNIPLNCFPVICHCLEESISPIIQKKKVAAQFLFPKTFSCCHLGNLPKFISQRLTALDTETGWMRMRIVSFLERVLLRQKVRRNISRKNII